MSAIDELKNGAKPKNVTRVNMMNGNKSTVSVADIAKTIPVEESEDNKGATANDYVADILNVDNPDSMFMEHYNNKVAEAKEWIAQKQEEAEEKKFAEGDPEADDDIGITLDAVEEDLDNPTMTSDRLSGNVVELDISGIGEGSSDDEDDDFGVSIDATEEEKVSIPNIAQKEIEKPVVVKEKRVEVKKEVVEEKPEPIIATDVNIEVTQSNEANEIDDSDEDDDDADSEEEKKREENLKRLQQIVADRLKPASLGLDLSSFTVAKKAETDAKEIFDSYKCRVSKWVVMNQESVIYMKEFSGSELELLMEYYNAYTRSIALARRLDTASVDTRSARNMYQLIYEHLDGAKPANFVTWMKITPMSDIDHYFFAIYLASFLGANFIPVDCTECKQSYVTEDIDIIRNMVRFPDDEARKKFTKIYNSNNVPASKGLYTTEVVPLTNKVAIGFKEPSIDDMLTINEVDRATQEKYSSIITLIPYIDAIYKIDMVNKKLIPIDYKKHDNSVSTTRSKIRKYDNIFKSMGIDAFTPVKAYVSAVDDKTTRGIDYIIPETKCPECGHVNPEVPIEVGSVADMVFTRCQLGALVSTSIS